MTKQQGQAIIFLLGLIVLMLCCLATQGTTDKYAQIGYGLVATLAGIVCAKMTLGR